MYQHVIKRLFDFILALFLLILAAIPMGIVAICIKLEDGGPVIYKSKRMGKGCKVFNTYKFRSMKVNREELHSNLTHEQMVTKVGKFIRKTSLDELPQLINILKGNMSIIGPRPALWNQDDLIAERDKYHANDIKPGLTGLAQINGRDELEIPVKAKLDGEYTEKISLWLDIKIFFKTIIKVFKKDGVVEGKVDKKETIKK